MYAPTQKEPALTRKNFFLSEIPNFMKASDQNIIINGDFNSIIDPKDREESEKKINWHLKYLIEKLKFVDSFRFMHPNETSFTFICPNGKSRIDKIFISKLLQNNIISIAHKPYIFSDHLAVILTLNNFITKNKTTKQKSNWKLNTSILEETRFKEIIENFCSESKKRNKIMRIF